VSSGPVVGDMNIADEHAFISAKATMADVSVLLEEDPWAAVFLRDDKSQEIIGVLTVEAVLASIAKKGTKPKSIKARDWVKENIIRLPVFLPLEEAIQVMREQKPDAVLIVDGDAKIVGYFSPEDYADATAALEERKSHLAKIEKTSKAIAVRDDDIANTLLSDQFEEEDWSDISQHRQASSNIDKEAEGEDEEMTEEKEVSASEVFMRRVRGNMDEDIVDAETLAEVEEDDDPWKEVAAKKKPPVKKKRLKRDEVEGILIRVYQENFEEPEKSQRLEKIPKLLDHYEGRYGPMLEELYAKYGEPQEPDQLGDDDQALDDVDGHLMVEASGIQTDDDFGGPEDVGGGDEQALDDVDGHPMVESTGIKTDDEKEDLPEIDEGPSSAVTMIVSQNEGHAQEHEHKADLSEQQTPPENPPPAIERVESMPEPLPESEHSEPVLESFQNNSINEEADFETWNLVKESDDPEDIQYYLDNFPSGKYAVPAKLRLKMLSR